MVKDLIEELTEEGYVNCTDENKVYFEEFIKRVYIDILKEQDAYLLVDTEKIAVVAVYIEKGLKSVKNSKDNVQYELMVRLTKY